jgi:hypothetical protein
VNVSVPDLNVTVSVLDLNVTVSVPVLNVNASVPVLNVNVSVPVLNVTVSVPVLKMIVSVPAPLNAPWGATNPFHPQLYCRNPWACLRLLARRRLPDCKSINRRKRQKRIPRPTRIEPPTTGGVAHVNLNDFKLGMRLHRHTAMGQ